MNPHHSVMNMPPMMNPVSPMGMGPSSIPPMSPIAVVQSPQPFRSHQPQPAMQEQQGPESLLHVSWHNSQWNPNMLNSANVLDYFANSSNPFYDRNCNNELLKMQRLPLEQLVNTKGTEYVVLHAMEPLFVIRKQVRHSPVQVTPLSDYYIIGGTAYQAPDLCSVINSRVLSALDHLRTSFEEALSYRKYSAAKGHYWEFKGKQRKSVNPAKEAKQQVLRQQEQQQAAAAEQQQRSTSFQRLRVDSLLGELIKKFPPPPPPTDTGIDNANTAGLGTSGQADVVDAGTSSISSHGGGITRTATQAGLGGGEGPEPKRIKTEIS